MSRKSLAILRLSTLSAALAVAACHGNSTGTIDSPGAGGASAGGTVGSPGSSSTAGSPGSGGTIGSPGSGSTIGTPGSGGTVGQAAPLFSEDFSTITPGDIVGYYNTGNPPNSQTMKDLYARGWSGEGYCPAKYGYCPGSVVVMPGPTGTSVHALLYKYEEGPDGPVDTGGTGLEVKLALETGMSPGHINPLSVNGGLKEVYVRYYLQTQPVPADTPSCTPNCPTTSTTDYNEYGGTKEHYWKSTGESGGPSWGAIVTNYDFGTKDPDIGYEGATDCPFVGGVFDCPGSYQNINHVSIQDNHWYCVEYHWKDNTVSPQVLANGDMEEWIDDKLAISSTGRQWDDATHQTALDYFMIYRQAGGYQWRYETDLVIDTKPIPCLDGWTPTPPSQGGTLGEQTLGPYTAAYLGKTDPVGVLLAQKAYLATAGSLQNLSFYVDSGAAGSMHLAVYSDNNGQPDKLLAKTADFTVVNGWNTQPVVTPVALQTGTYWLAYEHTDPGVQFLRFNYGSYVGMTHTWGALPASWGTSTLSGADHWSFYAKLGVDGTPP